MSINLLDPTTFTSSVYVTDTYTDNITTISGLIPSFPYKTINNIDTPISAAFAINSIEGGFYLGGMTTTQRNALNADNGLMVNNATTNTIDIYLNNAWASFATSGAGGDYGPGDPLYLTANATSMGMTADAAYPLTGNSTIRIGQTSASGAPVADGNFNTILGFGAATTAAAGLISNVIIGDSAAATAVDSTYNVFIGSQVAGAAPNTAVDSSVFIGYQAAYNATPNESVGIGYQALQNLTGGGGLVATVIGYQAFQALLNTDGNTGLGWSAGTLTTGAENTFIGDSAGVANVAGAQNTAVGYHAASGYPTYTACTFLGYGADGGGTGLVNATSIGANSIINANNAINFGAAQGTYVSLGINNTIPIYSVDIGTNLRDFQDVDYDVTGIRFANNSSGSVAALNLLGVTTLLQDGNGALVAMNGKLYWIYNTTGTVAVNEIQMNAVG